MKKIILIIMVMFSAIIITKTSYAYQPGTNVLTNPSYTVTYTSVTLAGTTPTIRIRIQFNGDAIGYDTILINGIYQINGIYDTSYFQTGIGQGYSPDITDTDYNVYYQGALEPILKPANVVKTLDESIKADTIIDLHYYYNPVGDNYNQAVSSIKTNVSVILITGGAGFNEGYKQALEDSELYFNNKIQEMYDTINHEKNLSFESARNFFGIFYNDEWLTATQYGTIRYNQGFDTGLDTEINWFEWSSTFFLMPFRILNIQILPGLRIGYFALFSLLIGVVGWFFFIVGKGGKGK